MSAYILAVDDDPDVLNTLSRLLKREGYEIGMAASAREARRSIGERRPDLLILDVVMPPGMDGLMLCRELRADERFLTLLILFLTARSSVDEVIAGLDAGGDDYLPKPFEINELAARVRALLRRTHRTSHNTEVRDLNGFRLDLNGCRISAADQTVQLTTTEFQLLRYLMEHPNQVISGQQLLNDVWGYPGQSGSGDLVRSHVRNLRLKLTSLPNGDQFIRTVHGIGYMIVA